MKRKITLGLICLPALLAFGWGQKGHDVTAYIAECHLSQAAADSVSAILDGKSLVYWANWLDNASYQPDYRYTKTWHYKNVDEDVAYEDAPLNPAGDCVTAIQEQLEILASDNATRQQKALALKIMTHLVGDLHQPMHLGHLSDRGGNEIKIKFFDRDANLHSVWDTSLPEAAHKWSYSEWQQQLDRLSPQAEAAVVAGSPDDWAKESVEIAGRIYKYFPKGSRMSYNQIAYWTPVVEQRFLYGGLRLASLLNAVFAPVPDAVILGNDEVPAGAAAR